MLYVSPDRPNVWKRPEFPKLIGEFRARKTKVSVSCNDVVEHLPT